MKTKVKVNLSKKQLGIIIAVIILGIVLIAGGVTCIVKNENPVQLATDLFANKSKTIVGKWQSSDNDALFGYEFFEDGTYKQYSFIGLNTNGNYEIKGNKLILKNPKYAKEIVFNVKVNNDELTLSKKEEDGEKTEKSVRSYKRVQRINLKKPQELLNDIKNNDSNK